MPPEKPEKPERMRQMVSEIGIRMKKIRRAEGTVLQMEVVTVDRMPKQLLANQKEYQRKFDGLLAGAGDFDRLDILIDSPGGNIASGMGLMGAVVLNLRRRWRKWEEHVRILVEKQCSSAATLMLGIAAPVYITPGGRIYIHASRKMTYRGKGQNWKLVSNSPGSRQGRAMMERTYKFRIRNMSRKKWNKKQVRGWIDEGKWFDSEEAVAVGFAGAVMGRDDFEKGVM